MLTITVNGRDYDRCFLKLLEASGVDFHSHPVYRDTTEGSINQEPQLALCSYRPSTRSIQVNTALTTVLNAAATAWSAATAA